MKKYFQVVGLAALVASTGCGNKEAGSKTTESTKPAPKAMPSIVAASQAPPAAVAPAPPGTPPPPGTAATAAAVVNAGQFNGLVSKTVDQQGDPMTAEKVLNRALEIYVEGMGKTVPKDLNELVRAKVLQSIPAAPAGKKWEFDAKQGKIVPVNQ